MLRLVSLYPDAENASSIVVTALCEDTRRLTTGAVFFAHVGSKQNGLGFINDAIMAGCVAIVVPENSTASELPSNIPFSIPVIRVANTRAEIARCAVIMFSHQPKHILAVTGTSGKTSVTYFAQQLCNKMQMRSVSIGTIGMSGVITRGESLTTPEAPELHAILNDITEQGVACASIEASSQAIIQHRLDATRITAAAFTNLSRDHLDYHGTIENYLAAKARLFANILPSDGTAIINVDDDRADVILDVAKNRKINTITFGHAHTADWFITNHTMTPNGQSIDFIVDQKSYYFKTNIAGQFQAMNIICALALATTCGFLLSDLIKHVPSLIAPPGRLQHIPGHPKGANIYVDYAHKPDALLNVLQALRAHHPNRLSVVFGCGGDRDTGKRAIMGDIAARYADNVIITDDNPRSEDPDAIREAILTGAHNAQTSATIQEVNDRRAAIETAITTLGENDILVIAGKGHEQGQKFATHTEPFDDVAVAYDIINRLQPHAQNSLPLSSIPLPQGRAS